MNRMIGVGEFCTSSITERSRCSNSPFIEAPACIRPMSSAQSLHAAQRRRHVAGRDALGKALDHRGLADAGLAGEDRVVLPPPHQHVDDLADLLVAAEDRVHLAGRGLGGEVLREAVERGRALRARGRLGARRAGGTQPRAVHRPQVLLLRAGPDRAVLGREHVDVDLGELLRDVGERAPQLAATSAPPTRMWPVRICVSPKNSVA